MTNAQTVYGALSVLSLLDLVMTLWAIYRASTRIEVGRLVGLALLLFGLLVSATERLVRGSGLTWGLVSIFAGLVIFVFVLPQRRRLPVSDTPAVPMPESGV